MNNNHDRGLNLERDPRFRTATQVYVVPRKAATGSSFYEEDTSSRLVLHLREVFDSRGRGFSGRLQDSLGQNYFSQDRAVYFLRVA